MKFRINYFNLKKFIGSSYNEDNINLQIPKNDLDKIKNFIKNPKLESKNLEIVEVRSNNSILTNILKSNNINVTQINFIDVEAWTNVGKVLMLSFLSDLNILTSFKGKKIIYIGNKLPINIKWNEPEEIIIPGENFKIFLYKKKSIAKLYFKDEPIYDDELELELFFNLLKKRTDVLNDAIEDEKHITKPENFNKFRELFYEDYSFSIPNENSLNKIIEFVGEKSILEIGSGLGLWAYLLRLSNITVFTTDEAVDNDKNWTDVEKLSYTDALTKYDDDEKVLMISSPPLNDDLVVKSLTEFKGNQLIYIGNFNNTFFNYNWTLHKKIYIPTFPNFDFKVYLYITKNQESREQETREQKTRKQEIFKKLNQELENVNKEKIYKAENHMLRAELGNMYSWSIPDEDSLNKIIEFVGEKSILEIGSGLGLWAYLLRLSNITVFTTDEAVDNDKNWTDVEKLSYTDALTKYDDDEKVLMLSWPPFDDDLAVNSLKEFKGNQLIYIGGYGDDSITANKAFFDELETNWTLNENINIATFNESGNNLYLYIKKKNV